MPTIKLTDQLGLDTAVQPTPGFAFSKYFKELPSLRLGSLDLKKLGGLTLDDPAIQSFQTGVSFSDPVSLGEGAPSMSVAAGVHGSIEFITDLDSLPGRDETLEKDENTAYTVFEIDATAGVGLSVPAGQLSFGASTSTTLELASYSRFRPKAGVLLTDAIAQTVAGFAIPLASADLAALPAGHISRAAVKGKLKLSGSANLLAFSNPLASASLPGPLPSVSVSAGGSATVGVSCTVQTEYEVTARKLDNGAVRLAWRHKDGSQVVVSAEVSAGISAGAGTTDLFSQVVTAISANAQADLQELQSAGLSGERAEEIQSAVKSATSRKLEIAVAAAFTASDTETTSFLYEINPGALDDTSRQAVDEALHGDLSGLHADALAGVRCVHSIWDHVRRHSLELDVHLLGILSFRSVASLSLEGKVMFEPATGALVITDRATAERIQTTQVNFGADTQKLRHVLAESFLITAAYRGAKQVVGAPSLRCSHNFFDLRNSTSPADVAAMLQTGVALGLFSTDDAQLPAGIADFGRTLFNASTDYDEALVSRMFLDANGVPLPRDLYESTGRAALQFLVQPTGDDAVRRRPAIEDDLWSRMKAVGQPGFSALFPGIPAPLVAAIVADYSTIVWWAGAMALTAQKLAAVIPNPNDPNLRLQLSIHLRQVAENTRNEFGQPWGLIAMSLLVNRTAGARILISGPKFVRRQQRALAAAGGS
jgi:hypothetical protein